MLVNVTESLVVIPQIHENENLVDMYVLITNHEEKDKYLSVEFDINVVESEDYEYSKSLLGLVESASEGPKTKALDLLGPYYVKSKESVLLAYQYKYTDEFADKYKIKASIFDGLEKLQTTESDLDLKK